MAYSSTLKLFSSRHIENFIIIGLDRHVEQNNDSLQTIAKLQQIIHCVKIFTSPDDCIDYILNVKDTHILLIISSTFNDELLLYFNKLPQIDAIYIFIDENKNEQHQWIESMKKFNKIVTCIENIWEKIHLDIIRFEHNLIHFNVIGKVIQDQSNRQEESFRYIQLLKETLLKTTDGDEHEIVQFSRIHYLNNPIELAFIDKFEQSYKEHSPVWWYTHPNFLYKILNKALQDQHVETLYVFRYFIRQLHVQLSNMPKNCAGQNAITLYRGQTMPNSQFNLLKENEGGLISVSNFLNTTSDIDVAMTFASHDDERKAVLMVIHIDMSARDNLAYGNIDSISCFNRQEKEWLFSMGSVFRISSIEKNNDDIWFVHLIFTNDQDPQLIVLMEHMRQTIQHSISLCQLGRLMLETDQLERAEQFYQVAIEKVTEWKDQVTILHQLGILYDVQDDLDEALNQFHRSLEIYRKNVSENDSILTWTYNVIGLIYNKQQKFDLSLEYFNHALHIELTMLQPNEESIARCYNNIASVYADQDKYPDALIYYHRELDIQQKILSSSHPSIAVSYSNVAYILYCLNRFTEAVEYQQKAIDIDLQSLPPEHTQTKQHKDLLIAYQKLTHVKNIRDESKP